MNTCSYRRRDGFTLIELLTVIAIIGILAAIIIPTTGAVRTAAKKAQTKSLFSNWSNAYTLFKQEYGYYPLVGTNNLIADDTDDTIQFVRTFTGKNLDGSAVTLVSDLNGNKRRQTFLSFSEAELPTQAPRLLTDAFGNVEFGVMVDINGDGVIKEGVSDDGDIPTVECKDTGVDFSPSTTVFPADGVRAGVIFFSAGKDGTEGRAVMSWR